MSKTLILSDIHFCRSRSPNKSAKAFYNLLNGFDALVLNGDTTEDHSLLTIESSKEQTDALISFASKEGIQTSLICGNHDPVTSDIDHVWFCDKSVLVFHGHAAFPGIAPWNWRSKYMRKSREEFLSINGNGFDEQLDAVRQASFEAASGKFKDHRPSLPHMLMLGMPAVFHILNGWRKYPKLVSDWVEQYAPTAKFIITGHTHHAGIWKQNNLVIINTGCFGFPSHPRAVVLENNTITVHRLASSNGNYSLGRVCASWNVR
jgi:predicted phosphodiesterase